MTRKIISVLFVLFCTIGVVAAETKRPLVTVMVSDAHYEADKRLPPMIEKIAAENEWDVAVLHGHGGSSFPKLAEVLGKTDSLVVYVRRLTLPKEQLAVFKRYVESGRGLVGLRTSCHGFTLRNKKAPDGCENWEEFDRDVLGGNYHDHGRNDLGSDIRNVESQADSTILQDVKPDSWHSDGSLYWTDPIKEDAVLYQIGSSPEGKNIPVTWTRMHGKTRVAFTAIGHPNDFETKTYEKLVRNLVKWSLNTPTLLKKPSNVD